MTKNKHAWFLSDLKNVPQNGIKVMTTFSCGGGSSMGYKLAGCDVIAANDIDKEMAYHYKLNHSPKHYFLMPIRDLLTADLPSELFELDILDGSPPCSTFSTAGNREKDWGKEKHFREGQANQVLSDLFFDFLDVADYLKPKVIIAENVKGMIKGNAKGYCKLVIARLVEMGYQPQLFLLNAADCGVPQRRERVFFCAVRNDVSNKKLELSPNEKWISAGEATSDLQVLTDDEIKNTKPTQNVIDRWLLTKKGDNFQKANKKINNKHDSWFNRIRVDNTLPSNTLTGHSDADLYHWDDCRKFTLREIKRLGSFPDDYQTRTEKIGKYMIGMSVPPKMTEVVARAVISQWLGK